MNPPPFRPRILSIVLVGASILAISFGVRQTIGVLVPMLTAQTGLSLSVFALALSVQNLLWGVATPFSGVIADRFGLRLVSIIGAALLASGFALVGLWTTSVGVFIGFGILVGLGVGATSFSIVLGSVAKCVSADHRAKVLGYVGSGGSIGQVLFTPLAPSFALGVDSVFVVIWTLSALCLLLVPLGMAAGRWSQARTQEVAPSPMLTTVAGVASRHHGYWLLNWGFFVCGFHVSFVSTHFPYYISTLSVPLQVELFGLRADLGGISFGLIGLFNIFGVIMSGQIAQRYREKYALSLLYGLRALLMLGFLLIPKSTGSVLLFSVGLGFLWLSTVPLTSSVVGRIFGVRWLATLFGITMLFHQVGAFFGAILGSWVYTQYQSFDIAWLVCIALGLISAGLHLPIADRTYNWSLHSPLPSRLHSPLHSPQSGSTGG